MKKNLPTELEDWSLSLIEALLAKEFYEDKTFDFKVGFSKKKNKQVKANESATGTIIPEDKNDDNSIARLAISFANTEGGFIVMGVADQGTKEKRLIGMDACDFAKDLGDQLKACTPTIHFKVLNPPLKLPNGKFINVAHIPKGSIPHGIFLEEKWIFLRREPASNRPMNHQELCNAFAPQSAPFDYHDKKVYQKIIETVTREAADYIGSHDFGYRYYNLEPISKLIKFGHFCCLPEYIFQHWTLKRIQFELWAVAEDLTDLLSQFNFGAPVGRNDVDSISYNFRTGESIEDYGDPQWIERQKKIVSRANKLAHDFHRLYNTLVQTSSETLAAENPNARILTRLKNTAANKFKPVIFSRKTSRWEP